jgi:hypothetical protein
VEPVAIVELRYKPLDGCLGVTQLHDRKNLMRMIIFIAGSGTRRYSSAILRGSFCA